MTGRTHDLAAFTALNIVIVTTNVPEFSLGTGLVALLANMIGGLAPDIDQPTTDFWDKMRGGNLISRLISPLLGGHRFISHSILGVIIFGFIANIILEFTQSFLLVDTTLVWCAFMIGYISHLLTDTITKDGVPWLFPLPIKFGIPPLKVLRMKTGGILEKSFVFPGLLVANLYVFYQNYQFYLEVFRNLH